MSLTALRRTAAPLAVLAATAAGLAVTPVLRADATTRAGTSLSIRTVHSAIAPGHSDRVTGHLGIAGAISPAGRAVTLEARPMGTDSFTPVAPPSACVRRTTRPAASTPRCRSGRRTAWCSRTAPT